MDSPILNFVCPICKAPLKKVGENLFCATCNHNWKICNGIYDFSSYKLYWNQLSVEDMNHIIRDSLKKGWETAIKNFFGNKRLYLQDYIIDESRADWHFYIPISPEAKVLDIGAGWGAISIALARNYKSVFATDTNMKNLEFLKVRAQQESLKNIIFVKIDPLDYPKFPFPDSSFDLIALSGVLEWVGNVRFDKNPFYLQTQALKRIFSILKPGGFVYIGIENRYALKNFLGAKPHNELPFVSVLPRAFANMITRWVNQKPHRTYVHSRRAYFNLLRKVGFDAINFYWMLPSYRFPSTIIPIDAGESIDYWKHNIMISSTSTKRLVKKMIFTVLPKDIFCENFGIISQKIER